MFVFHLIMGLILAAAQAGAAQPGAANPQAPAQISQLIDKAGAGDARAQFALGQAYADGKGVAQNFDLALKWYHKAADQGNADAENAIGVMYRTGSGVEKSKEQALAWYREAARQGSGPAMFNLGAAYYNGDGVDISDAIAYAWFTLGKEAGIKNAVDAVSRMDEELRPETINAGLRTIAEMYADGGQVKQSEAESVRWYRKAAERGDLKAQLKLAAVLIAGQGAPKDYIEGRKWCEAAAKEGSAEGELCLGHIYRAGLGVERDPKEAIRYLTQAAQWNNAAALRMLGEMYEDGEAGTVDHVAAFVWFLRSALYGDKDARETAVKIKGAMTQAEWSKAKKKMRDVRMDPQKVEAFLVQSGGG